MQIVNIPLSNGFYVDEAQNLSNQECLNLYPVMVQTQNAFNTTALRAPAGITSWSSETEGSCRGVIRLENKLYGVFGNKFYKIAEDGTKTEIGVPVAGEGRVAIAENGIVITVVIPGTPTGYFYDSSLDTFVEIDNEVFIDYGDKLDVTYKDGYFIYVTEKEFFLSSLVITNNGKDFNGLDFGTAEINTDNNVGAEIVRNELHIFGQKTVEVFQNIGATFPFQRISGAAVDRGLAGTFAKMAFQNSYVFLGGGENEGLSIWMGMSGQSQVISTPAIDNILQSLPTEDLANTYMFKYSESGNFFAVITIPNQITLVFDETTSKAVGRPIWHRRSSSLDGVGPWRVNDAIQAYGKILCTDNMDGRVGFVDIDNFQDYNESVLRRFNTGYTQADGARFRVPLLELSSQVGTSAFIQDVASTENYAILRISEDGVSYTHPIERALPSTPGGLTRSQWHALGIYDVSLSMQFDLVTDKKVVVTKVVMGIG